MKCGRSRPLAIGVFASIWLLSISPSAAQAPPTGPQKTLVIVGDFTDQPVSCSVATITSTMFAPTLSVDALYRDNSGGALSLTGDVVGPVPLGRPSTDPCSLSGLANTADAAAAARGVDVASYPRRVYVMPPNSCGAGGHGGLGGSPSQAWIFACDMPGVFAHNLGHNLGMTHAASGAPMAEEEYGDPSDPMAFGSNRLPGFNAPHRHQMGWLDTNALVNVSSDADMRIAPLDLDANIAGIPQVVRIRKNDSGEFYYISYRRAQGFDRYMDSRFFDRVTVHRYKGDGSSTNTFLVGNLGAGETFTDATNGVTIAATTLDSTSAGLRIRLTSPLCQVSAPAITVQPPLQQGTAGSSLAFDITLTNQDSSGCGSSSFTLSPSVPSGWTAMLSAATVTIAPGTTGTARLSVTSPAVMASGDYPVAINIAGSDSGHTAAGAVTYRVQSVTDTVPPTAPTALSARLRSKRVELTWTASTDNDRVGGYRILRNGTVVTTVQGTQWTDPAPTADQTYHVQAYDPAGNQSVLSNGATVSAGGRRK